MKPAPEIICERLGIHTDHDSETLRLAMRMLDEAHGADVVEAEPELTESEIKAIEATPGATVESFLAAKRFFGGGK